MSNVVKINCDASESRIKNQFYDFFKAYHKRRSGDWNIDITSVTAWKFDSAQKAEMKRRELIGAYEEKDYYGKIYLVTDFNYLCD